MIYYFVSMHSIFPFLQLFFIIEQDDYVDNEGSVQFEKNVIWMDDMDDTLIESLLDQMQKGLKIGGTFVRSAYVTVANILSDTCVGKTINADHVKNRIKTLKGNFASTKDFLKTSGFGFNHSTQMIEAPTDVWETYIKVICCISTQRCI